MLTSHVEAVPSEMFAWVVSRVDGAAFVVRTAVYHTGGALRKPWMTQGRWFDRPEEAVEAAVLHNIALLARTEVAKPTPFTAQAVSARALSIPDEMVMLGYVFEDGQLRRSDL